VQSLHQMSNTYRPGGIGVILLAIIDRKTSAQV